MNSAKKKIAVLTGAGVSAESGLSTFRGNNGLWGEYDPEEVASIQGWYRNRELVLNFYNGLRKRLSEVKPNAAHYAIADLEKEYSVTVITQNVDNLHERAGSTKVLHLHGEATKVRPEDGEYDRSYSEKRWLTSVTMRFIWGTRLRTAASCVRTSFSSGRPSRTSRRLSTSSPPPT